MMSGALAEVLDSPGPYSEADDDYAEVKTYLASAKARKMRHSDLERELHGRGQELLRKLLQGHLDSRAPGEADGPVEGSDGVVRNEKREHSRQLESVFGRLEVKRTGYAKEGVASLHPLDAELNLPAEVYSLEVRRRVAKEVAKVSFDEAIETVASYTGAKVPKRQAEELVVRAAQDFDAFYQFDADEELAEPSETGPLLVITVDGKGVVMHKEDLRPETRKKAERKRQRLRVFGKLHKGEKRNSKRMAAVAAVYTVAPYVRTPEQFLRSLARLQPPTKKAAKAELAARPRPENKRVWASVEKDSRSTIEQAFLEAGRRDLMQSKTWLAVVDGDETQLAQLEEVAEALEYKILIILDIIHVVQYLWKAGHAFHEEETPELEYWVLSQLRSVLEGKARKVASAIRRSATIQKLDTSSREPVDRCANYLRKNAAHMRYDEYLAAGYPIASGVIEGACRHLIADRMELTGARWRLASAEAVLRLRALRSSGDFDRYWVFHEAREYQRNHAERYAEGKIPPTVSPEPPEELPPLRRVK